MVLFSNKELEELEELEVFDRVPNNASHLPECGFCKHRHVATLPLPRSKRTREEEEDGDDAQQRSRRKRALR
jgi:hypothetical protein